MIVRFIKNPVGKYNLSYEVGQEIDLPDSQAVDLIEDKYAELVRQSPVQTAESKVKKEKAVTRKK